MLCFKVSGFSIIWNLNLKSKRRQHTVFFIIMPFGHKLTDSYNPSSLAKFPIFLLSPISWRVKSRALIFHGINQFARSKQYENNNPEVSHLKFKQSSINSCLKNIILSSILYLSTEYFSFVRWHENRAIIPQQPLDGTVTKTQKVKIRLS